MLLSVLFETERSDPGLTSLSLGTSLVGDTADKELDAHYYRRGQLLVMLKDLRNETYNGCSVFFLMSYHQALARLATFYLQRQRASRPANLSYFRCMYYVCISWDLMRP